MPDAYENFNMAMLNNILTDDNQYLTYNDIRYQTSMYNANSLSPNTFQENASVSPMSTSSSPQHMTDLINLNNVSYRFEAIGEPYISIIVQPVEKFRFRYKSEMVATHGALLGVSDKHMRKKTGPIVQLHNFSDKAIIRCALVTSDDSVNRIPHAHKLVRRHGFEDLDEPHDIEVSADNNFTATFNGMGIIHTAKKYFKEELLRKMRSNQLDKLRLENVNASISIRDDAEIKMNVEQHEKSMNMNSVSLSFQAFIKDDYNIMRPLTAPVYSTPINNLKSALTGELKICRIDKHTSSCEGNEEVFIFVEKVGKKNIRIKFFEMNENDVEVWCDYGRFSELDVHHQYAIAFRTPPYKDLNITKPVDVFLQLERLSDSDCSDPIKFAYKPSDRIIGRKRTRVSYSNSAELTQLACNVPTDVATNNSSELSKEIKKILDQDRCSSSEFRDFVETDLDIDLYANFLANSEENKLTCDGPLKKCDDDKAFARNIVSSVLKSLKTQTNKDKNNEMHIIKSLLQDRSTYGDSPLHAALRYGQKEIAKYIFMLISLISDPKKLLNMQNSSGKTPLHYATTLNQPENTGVLLLLGADPNLADHCGQTPLHNAVKIQGAKECVDILLRQKNIEFETYTDLGWTPLHLAAEAGSYHSVQSLIKIGADVNKTDMSCGRTALHIAVEGGHVDIVKFLLKNSNIDVNKKNFSGNTALHNAVVTPGAKAKEICALLIVHGADPHIRNHNRELNNEEAHENILSIKTELDTVNENVNENEGQSSFDLASDNPDILRLVSLKSDAPLDVIKEEEIHESERIWLNTEQEKQLAEILNNTKGWKKLVYYFNFTYLLKSEKNLTNPALFVLNFILIENDISIQQLHDVLQFLGEEKAIAYLKQILY